MHAPLPQIRVGPAGWSYPDWHGIVYPTTKPPGFREPEYLARFFDTLEINTSFYSPLRPAVARTWVRSIEHNKNFKFTAKLWRHFTHDRNATHHDEKLFKEGLNPLVEMDRLGALLVQFPWSFKNAAENRDYLAGLFMQFVEYPLVLEVRHSSWNEPEILEMLAELRVGFCNIDQPVMGRSIKPSGHSTSAVGYVRLHGRNYAKWFTSKERSSARYDYLYSMDELEPWVERIRKVADASEVTYVITNNHFEGKAVANGLELLSLLTDQKVDVPDTLVKRYPELANIAASTVSSETPVQPMQAELLFDTPLLGER
jgi:uncharacterized protein YecE (DUF72 family)